LKNLAFPDDRRTTIRQKNLKHGGLVTLSDTVAFLVPVGVFVVSTANSPPFE
jgi:hypothetical protein